MPPSMLAAHVGAGKVLCVLPEVRYLWRSVPFPVGSASSKIQAARASALLFARAMRKPSQRIADKVVESTNNQMMAAIDPSSILFIADAPAGLRPKARRRGQGLFRHENSIGMLQIRRNCCLT
jgi:hypothetical protein